jgi:hypothetical protein
VFFFLVIPSLSTMGRFLLTALICVQLAVVSSGCRRSVPTETPDDATHDTAGEQSSEPTSAEDSEISTIEAIFQVVLNQPELEAYWHVDEAPDRSPLLILANETTPTDLVLSMFDESVQILPAEEVGDRPYFEFRSFERSGNRASVSFAYEVEGVIGTVELELNEGLWIITDRSLAEQ